MQAGIEVSGGAFLVLLDHQGLLRLLTRRMMRVGRLLLETAFHKDKRMSYVYAISQWSLSQAIGFALAIIVCMAWMLGNYALVSTLFRVPQYSRSGALLRISQRILQLIQRLDQEIKSSGHAVVGPGQSMKTDNKETQNSG